MVNRRKIQRFTNSYFFRWNKYKCRRTISFFRNKKICNTPNTYLLLGEYDNKNEMRTLGNIIDGRLVSILTSSVYSNFNIIDDSVRASTSVDDKLVHNFCGILNNKQTSGTGILERYC